MSVDILTYVTRVKEIAYNESLSCGHPFRTQLAYGHESTCPCIQSDERNTCGSCIQCTRCLEQWKPETMIHAPHGSKGDFDNFPEVYISDTFYKPWYTQKTEYAVLPYNFKQSTKELCISEDTVMAGLDALESEFPHMKAWITLYPIHVALYKRWMRVAARLSEWMTRRMMYFTPGGIYAHMSQALSRVDIRNTRLYNNGEQFDHPVEALEGEYNLPYLLHFRDSFNCGIEVSNPNLLIPHIMRDKSGGELDDLIDVFGYIWASNSRHWCLVEGESFYSESVRRVLQRVAHGPNRSVITCVKHWQRFERRYHVLHSARTQCRLCRTGALLENTQPRQMFPVGKDASVYERVLSCADLLRRRRLWGVFFCAARLLPKARAVRFVPGIGSEYKKAAARYTETSRKTA